MAKRQASVHDQEEPQSPSRSKPQAKVASIKKDGKKPAPKKTPKTKPMAMPELSLGSRSANGDMQARIAERAYELHRHRGGHHGQDLEDWLAAEREVLSEEECCS
ncbi:MAG: DUF2934 domain-containing protein [Nitrospirota bacterium]|nr:DUF2934 domain-containing protein [Nitrospirota bacterium]